MVDDLNIAYLATSAVLAFASLASRTRHGARFWLSLSLGILVLDELRSAQAGVWIVDLFNDRLRGTAWYEHRRLFQVACIAAFAVVLGVGVGRLRALSSIFGSPLARSRTTPAIWAFCALLFLAAVRFSSFHWTDEALSVPVGPLMLSHILQAVLLLLIAAEASFDLLNSRQSHASIGKEQSNR